MRQKLYNALVNKVPGIAYRYHKHHDGTYGLRKILSWIYLFALNFGYYVLFMRFLGRKPNAEIYENHMLSIGESESRQDAARNPKRTVDQYTKELSQYDVISFDVTTTPSSN